MAASSVDPSRYPLTAAYLAALPAGLESYPDCLVKSDVHTNLRDSFPQLAEDASLPPVLLRYLRAEHRDAWFSEVAGCTLLMLLRDTVFPTDDAAVAWVHDNMGRIYEKPLFRVLMFVLSPTLIVMGATRRWEAFHRGSTLVASPVERAGGRAKTQGTLSYPSRLFNDMLLRQFGAAFHAALASTRASQPEVRLEPTGPAQARFVASWAE